MKRRILLITTCALLISVLLVAFSGCEGILDLLNSGENTDSTNNSDVTEDMSENNKTDNKLQYNQEPEDLDGFALDVLSVKSGMWNMHTDFAPTVVDGSVINTAVYRRNETVSKLYNATIVAHEDAEYYHMTEKLAMDQLSGGQAKYDAAYVEGSSVVSPISQGQVMNLYDVPEIQLDQEWWSQLIKREATLGTGKYSTLYFTQSNLSLTSFDLTWCVYFNKTIQTENQIEDLYALVENDQWTIEKMKSIAKQAATLGSDSNFTYEESGTSVYGITTYWNGVKAMLDGCQIQFVTTDTNGDPAVNISNERFANLTQDLAELFAETGTFTYGGESTDGSTKGNASDYLKIFNAERALFCVAEVKSSVNDFKTFKGQFGILPLPKYDTDQNDYRSWVNYLAPVLVIPSTLDSDTLHNTAVLLDALSFYSERDVLPEYYDTVLKGRGTSDSQSIKMLDLINKTKSFDASIAYGWSRQFSEVLSNALLNGVTDVSSLAQTYEGMITENIKTTLESILE